MNLIDFGYEIEYTKTVRYVKNREGVKEESSILSDFYLKREFTDSELRLLIENTGKLLLHTMNTEWTRNFIQEKVNLI